MAWEPYDRSNFFFRPSVRLCAVINMSKHRRLGLKKIETIRSYNVSEKYLLI